MIEKEAWEEFVAQRDAMRAAWMQARKEHPLDNDPESEREKAWEKYSADMKALRDKFGITAFANHRLTEYQVSVFTEADDPDGHIGLSSWTLTVAYRGRDRWAVTDGHRCLNKSGAWDYEMRPSERGDEWLAEHRFTRAEALALAYKAAPDVTVNGWTAAELKIELLMKGKIK